MKTLNSSWKKQLCQTLKKINAERVTSRLVVLGIGNEMNGDDAAGVLVVRSLQVICEKRNDLLLVEGGIAPENFSGQLRRFKPDLVLMVDAADFGGEPGEVSWIEPGQIDGFSASTHSLPPSMLADFLVHEIGCEVCFLGIQAVSLEFGQPLSGAVRKACRQITSEVKKNLSRPVGSMGDA